MTDHHEVDYAQVFGGWLVVSERLCLEHLEQLDCYPDDWPEPRSLLEDPDLLLGVAEQDLPGPLRQAVDFAVAVMICSGVFTPDSDRDFVAYWAFQLGRHGAAVDLDAVIEKVITVGFGTLHLYGTLKAGTRRGAQKTNEVRRARAAERRSEQRELAGSLWSEHPTWSTSSVIKRILRRRERHAFEALDLDDEQMTAHMKGWGEQTIRRNISDLKPP